MKRYKVKWGDTYLGIVDAQDEYDAIEKICQEIKDTIGVDTDEITEVDEEG